MKKTLVSPITQGYCDKKLVAAVKSSVLYQLAKKDAAVYNPQTLGGALPLLTGYGKAWPWPSECVRHNIQSHCNFITQNMDGAIAEKVTRPTDGQKNVIEFKKALTPQNIAAAVEYYERESGRVYWGDNFGKYLICATSLSRMDGNHSKLADSPNWSDEMTYMDDLTRPYYKGEYGRLKIRKDLNVVFLNVLDDAAMESVLFGPMALTVTPADGNMHATFDMPTDARENNPARGLVVGWIMNFGAALDETKGVVLRAQKPVVLR